MHLLRTQPGGFVPDDGIAHLAQTPAELVILCSGDSHLALLAEAARALPDDYPSLRLANPMQLQNHASVDLYVEEVLRHARVILLSLHGGIGYWRYGVEQLVALAERGALLIPVPGDDRPDPELSASATCRRSRPSASGNTCARAAWRTPGSSTAAWPASASAATTPGANRRRCRGWRCSIHGMPRRPWNTGVPTGRPGVRWSRCCSIAPTCRQPTPPSSHASANASRRRGSTRCRSRWPASRKAPAWRRWKTGWSAATPR